MIGWDQTDVFDIGYQMNVWVWLYTFDVGYPKEIVGYQMFQMVGGDQSNTFECIRLLLDINKILLDNQ